MGHDTQASRLRIKLTYSLRYRLIDFIRCLSGLPDTRHVLIASLSPDFISQSIENTQRNLCVLFPPNKIKPDKINLIH